MISKWLHISGKAFRIQIYTQFPIKWHPRLALMEVSGQKFLVIPYLDLPPPSIHRHKLRWTDNSVMSWFVSGSRIEDSTPLIPKPALGHDPEPFPCVFQVIGVRCVFNIHVNVVPVSVLFSDWRFLDNFLCRNSVSILCLSSLTCQLDYNRLKILSGA